MSCWVKDGDHVCEVYDKGFPAVLEKGDMALFMKYGRVIFQMVEKWHHVPNCKVGTSDW